MNDLESKVEKLLKESIQKRMKGVDRIDPILEDSVLVGRWLTDIKAIGYNHDDLSAAANDIFEIQHGLSGVFLDDVRARVFLSQNRFPDEIEAFKRYVELQNTEKGNIVLFAVKKELEMVSEGSLLVI
jgi:hypothetical protein